MTVPIEIGNILVDISEEYEHAILKFPPFRSAHEGYAIILEEMDELWKEVTKQYSKRSPQHMRKEAIQIATMALRFVDDICDRPKIRR